MIGRLNSSHLRAPVSACPLEEVHPSRLVES